MKEDLSPLNRRNLQRLGRSASHKWELKVNGDSLITKNISNISPSGLAFKALASTVYKRGQALKIHLSLTGQDHFDGDAEIVWIKETSDSHGSMKLLGLRFLYPSFRFDTAIMSELHSNALKERRALLAEDLSLSRNFHQNFKIRPNIRSLIKNLCALITLISMTTALITAVYLHQKAHPEESIEFKFNEGLMKKKFDNKK
jgi:hypothetical protein